MLFRLAFLTLLGGCLLHSAPAASAQVMDIKGSTTAQSKEDNDDRPKSFKETLVKMRIEKEKKDFEQMLDRGREALKLSEELERTYASYGRLAASDMNKLIEVEKLVKKIRSELGGNDDSGDDKSVQPQRFEAVENGNIFKSFRKTTSKLIDELQKTSRFTVSATAIQASNAVLKLARILRISK